jgi:hypothetical protein
MGVMVQEATQDNLSGTATLIRFIVGGQPIAVSVHDVRDFFGDINRYNNHFSVGSMLGRLLDEPIQRKPEEQAPVLTTLGLEESNQQAESFIVAAKHKQLLNDIGLTLEPVSGKSNEIMALGESAGAGEMRINISDKDRFVSFLGAIKPEQIDEVKLRTTLETIPSILSNQILDAYDLQAPGETAMQLFSSMDTIVTEYKRLGMGDAVSRLETYLIYGKQGDLREYISIEKQGLFAEPGITFGPATWQTDMLPQMLEDKWRDAFQVLEMLRQNPNGKNLYSALRDQLIRCADFALTEQQTRGVSRFAPAVRTHITSILEQAKQHASSFVDMPQLDL